ncbi:MAG TPA: hypothetical protein VLH86_03695 [Patescibacteria group bacterium]|nr:hypothetical protein [Patescibacteria group bacterium]
MSNFPETDVQNRVLSLGLPPESLVVAGSAAIETIVGSDVRRAQDIDLTVTPDVYRHLRNQPGMEEVTNPNDGYASLKGNGFDISTDWYGRSVADLQQGGYVKDGVYMAGLPDIYALKQERGLDKDNRDLQIIRDRVYGSTPLPLAVVGNELTFVRGFMPEHLRERRELEVAANGLYVVRTVFGHEGGTVRTYSGTVEQRQVPATYHAWEHSALGARDGQRNIDALEAARRAQGLPPQFDDDARVAEAVGFTNHDVVLGHGRRAANPEGHDEKQSAELAVRHLEAVGVTNERVLEGTYATTIVTTFNEAKKAQDIDPSRGYVPNQEVGAGSDMSGFRREDARLNAVRLLVEDLSRVGAGYDAPLNRLVDQINADLPEGAEPVRIRTTEDGLRLIDENPDFVVTKAGDPPITMTLREAAAMHLEGSGKFCGGYKFPESWVLGDPAVQAANARGMQEDAAAIRDGRATTVDVLRKVSEIADGTVAIVDPGVSNETADKTTGRRVVTGEGAGVTAPEGSVAAIREAVRQTLELLPHGHVAQAAEILGSAIANFTLNLEGSSNEYVVTAHQALAQAQELLASVAATLQAAADNLERYDQNIL